MEQFENFPKYLHHPAVCPPELVAVLILSERKFRAIKVSQTNVNRLLSFPNSSTSS